MAQPVRRGVEEGECKMRRPTKPPKAGTEPTTLPRRLLLLFSPRYYPLSCLPALPPTHGLPPSIPPPPPPPSLPSISPPRLLQQRPWMEPPVSILFPALVLARFFARPPLPPRSRSSLSPSTLPPPPPATPQSAPAPTPPPTPPPPPPAHLRRPASPRYLVPDLAGLSPPPVNSPTCSICPI